MSLNGLPGRKRLVAPRAGFITTSMAPAAAPARTLPEDQDARLPAPANTTAATPAALQTSTRRPYGRDAMSPPNVRNDAGRAVASAMTTAFTTKRSAG